MHACRHPEYADNGLWSPLCLLLEPGAIGTSADTLTALSDILTSLAARKHLQHTQAFQSWRDAKLKAKKAREARGGKVDSAKEAQAKARAGEGAEGDVSEAFSEADVYLLATSGCGATLRRAHCMGMQGVFYDVCKDAVLQWQA